MKIFKYKDVDLYEKLHKEDSGYGACSPYTGRILKLIKSTGSKNILDFGCGKGVLKQTLKGAGINIDEYDPAIEGKKDFPQKEYDLIITTDVLEHIHKDEIVHIFSEFKSLNPKFMFHAISTRLAAQILSDGSNAHKTVENGLWWEDEFISNIGGEIKLEVNPKDIKHSDIALIYYFK